MNQIRNPLRFNVGFLIHEPIGTSRDIHFDFTELRLNPDLDLKELHGVVRVGKTPQGILLQASFNAMVDAECVRCLASFEQPLHTDFSELFAFTPRSVSESGLVLPEDGYIQFEPLVREYILVEVPIRPLCREDCKGLCQVCGEDLNESTCEHEQRVPLD